MGTLNATSNEGLGELLFREFNITLDSSGSGKWDGEEGILYQEAKKGFLERLHSTHGGVKGVDFVNGVYSLMDDLTEEYLQHNQVTCHKGCDYCCHQLVTCTTLEMKVIQQHLESVPRPKRRAIKQHVKKESIRFYRSYNAGEFSSSNSNSREFIFSNRWEGIANPLRDAYYGKPCLYLMNKACSIYPARPVDCRSAKTKDVCGQKDVWVKLKGIHLFFDQVAADLIMDEEKKFYHKLQVVPLVSWPVTMEFKDYFF